MPTRVSTTDIADLSIKPNDISSNQKRIMSWQREIGSTIPIITNIGTNIGISSIISNTSFPGTFTNSDTSNGPFEQIQNGAAVGASCGRQSFKPVTQRSWDFNLSIRILTGSAVSNIRYWFGLTDSDISNVASASLTTQNVIAFKYEAGIDTNWSTITCDGASNITDTDSGIVVATSAANPSGYNFHIRSNSATDEVLFSINDTLVSTHSTNLPLSTTQLKWFLSIVNISGAAQRRFAWAYVSLSQV